MNYLYEDVNRNFKPIKHKQILNQLSWKNHNGELIQGAEFPVYAEDEKLKMRVERIEDNTVWLKPLGVFENEVNK